MHTVSDGVVVWCGGDLSLIFLYTDSVTFCVQTFAKKILINENSNLAFKFGHNVV